MILDPNPIYRKVIIVWYDSEAACFLTLIFLLAVFIFAYLGIQVALDTLDYRKYVWIPGVVAGLSVGVMVSITVRLVRRFLQQIGR